MYNVATDSVDGQNIFLYMLLQADWAMPYLVQLLFRLQQLSLKLRYEMQLLKNTACVHNKPSESTLFFPEDFAMVQTLLTITSSNTEDSFHKCYLTSLPSLALLISSDSL